MSSSYSRNKYRCLLKPHNQNVIVSHDNNIQPPNPNPHFYPCLDPYPGIEPYYPGYPCIGPYYPYAQKMQQEPDQNQPPIPKPTLPIPKPTPQPRLYPYGPYPGAGIGPYYGGPYYGGPYYGGPYYPGGLYPNGPYPYSQKIKEKVNPSKKSSVGNEDLGENIGNMKPHCEYYSSSSSSSSDSDRYRRRYRRYAKVSGETDTKVAPEGDTQVFEDDIEKDSNRVFDEQNQKPYPIPKPRPKPKPDPSFNPTTNSLNEENQPHEKKSFAKPLANLFTKFTTPEKEPENQLIQVLEDEKKEKNEKNLIFLKV